MKKLIGSLLLVVMFTGCRAEMMEKRGDSIKVWAPLEKQTRSGVIRYLNTGLKAWRRARRTDAEKQMRQFCGAPYKILAEGPRSKFGAEMPIGSSVSVEVDQYWYIRFDCEDTPAK